jgi:hypothetical protein
LLFKLLEKLNASQLSTPTGEQLRWIYVSEDGALEAKKVKITSNKFADLQRAVCSKFQKPMGSVEKLYQKTDQHIAVLCDDDDVQSLKTDDSVLVGWKKDA